MPHTAALLVTSDSAAIASATDALAACELPCAVPHVDSVTQAVVRLRTEPIR